MIELTDKAIDQFTKKTQDQGNDTIRIGYYSAGCNGFKYMLDYADTVHTDDHVIDYGNFLIVVETGQLHNFSGLTLDYVSEGLNSQFVFLNPNESTSCGCGESVSF
jgi:iron-sulfur cluster assembly protein